MRQTKILRFFMLKFVFSPQKYMMTKTIFCKAKIMLIRRLFWHIMKFSFKHSQQFLDINLSCQPITRVWLGSEMSGFMTAFAINMCRALGKNTSIYLFVSPIDAGSQKCTQGTPSVKGRKKSYLKLVN